MDPGFDGNKYAEASAHQKEWGRRIIGELQLTGPERVLDLGCGDGALTFQLAVLVPDGFAIGIDSSASMIAAAAQYRRPNLRFELLAIEQLEYEKEFDLIFSNAALHWVKNHEVVISRVIRAIKEEGICRFSFPANGNCPTFNETIQALMSESRYAKYFSELEWPWYMPDTDAYREFLHRFPFREIRVWPEKADRFFPDAGALIRWIDQPCLVPFLPAVPESEREHFRAEVVRRMLDSTRRDGGRYFEKFRRIHVLMRK